MGKKDFDNLLMVLEAAVLYIAGTTVSVEMDFEIPRGFIVKIHIMELRVENWGEDLETAGSDTSIRYLLALLRDPDDTVTVGLGSNVVQHDVLMDHQFAVVLTAGTAGDWGGFQDNPLKQIFIQKELDVISARNMRLNAVAEGTDLAGATEAIATANVWYTLEEVTDVDILNLLGIL